ncbi:DUF6461 domain-containing protein [Streptomyces sp. NPDC059862]|uniref:DUF6461 domain-containing protein n=1 Tax=unclassified Streptomyces TaxID=2593676 RepID=UPI00363602F8
MRPSASDYAWFRDNELCDAYCMTYIRDVPPAEFLARLDATPYTEQQGLRALVSTYWDDPLEFRGPWQFVGATSVPGRDGPWTLAVEINGFMGSLTEYMGPASAARAPGPQYAGAWDEGSAS